MWARDLQGCSQVLKFGERFEHEARCAFKPIEAEEKKIDQDCESYKNLILNS